MKKITEIVDTFPQQFMHKTGCQSETETGFSVMDELGYCNDTLNGS